jgi:hypothetical protein
LLQQQHQQHAVSPESRSKVPKFLKVYCNFIFKVDYTGIAKMYDIIQKVTPVELHH